MSLYEQDFSAIRQAAKIEIGDEVGFVIPNFSEMLGFNACYADGEVSTVDGPSTEQISEKAFIKLSEIFSVTSSVTSNDAVYVGDYIDGSKKTYICLTKAPSLKQKEMLARYQIHLHS